MNHFPKPGTPEFNRLKPHQQKRALENAAQEKRFRNHGFVDAPDNVGQTHIKATVASPNKTGCVFYSVGIR